MDTILNEGQVSRGVPPLGRSASRGGFDLAIDDNTATEIFNRIDLTDGMERDALATQLENWASRKIAEGQTSAAKEHERIYTDINGWWNDLGGDDVPEDVKYGAANRKFIADQFGQTPLEQVNLYPSFRDKYFLKAFGKVPSSEAEAYKKISESISARMQAKQAVDLITGDVALALFNKANTGQPVDVPALMTKWKEENAQILDAMPEEWEAIMLKAANEYAAESESLLREHGPVLQNLYNAVQSATGRGVRRESDGAEIRAKTPEMTDIVDELAKLPKEARDRGFSAILMAAKRQGMDEKGFFEMFGEAIGSRLFNPIRDTLTVVGQEMAVQERLRLLESGEQTFFNKDTGSLMGVSDARAQKYLGDMTPISDEERSTMLEDARKEAARFDVLREVRNFADGQFDPIKSPAKNTVGKFAQDIFLLGPQSLSYTAMAAVPYAGPVLAWSAIFSAEYNQLRLEGFTAQQAKDLASVSAPIQTALEVTGAKLLFGRFDWYKNLIAKLVNPARFGRAAQSGVSFFGKVLGENITEGLQDPVTPLVQDVANSLGMEVSDVDWSETLGQWADSRLEVFAATLMPVIGGHLVETYADSDRFQSSEIREKVVYGPLGITPDEKKFIEDGATPEEKRARFNQTLKNMPAERVQEVKAKIAAEGQAANGDQRDNMKPTMEAQKDANGRMTYIVRDEAGKEVYRTNKQAAAEEAYVMAMSKSTAAKFNEEKIQLQGLTKWWLESDPKRASNEQRTLRATSQGTAQQKLEALQQANNKQGIEELHRRIAQSPYAGTPYDQIQILGEASVEQVGEMVFRSVIALNKNSRVRDAREEMHHTAVRMAVANGRVDEQTMRDWLEATERVFAEKGLNTPLPRADMADIVESMAVVQEAFENERISADVEMSLPQAFVDYIKRMIQVFVEVLKRGKAIREALDAGVLPSEFEAFLVETTGVADQTAVDRARERTEQEVAPEAQNYSIGLTPQMDAEYLAAVERGDMEMAQRMVDDAARAAGYDIGPVWHGGADGFTVFDWNRIGEQGTTEGKGFYFSNDRDLAAGYADRHGGRLLRVYLRSGKPIDGKKQTITQSKWRQILRLIHVESEKNEEGTSPLWNYADIGSDGLDKAINEAAANITEFSESDVDAISGFINGGADPQITYDAIYKLTGMTGIVESEAWGRDGHTIQIATSANHVKLADPVTYDADGNVIPLSQRFDATTADISYSISTQSEIDRVQAAMGAIDRSPLDTLEITEKLRKRFASIMAENMVELAAMRQGSVAEREVLDEEGNPIGPQPDAPRTKASGAEIRRTKLLQALGELDGLLSALPPQVAAKVGGYTVLTNIGTGDRAFSNFFIKRLEMIDKELERYLKDRYTKALNELFKRARPKRDEAGKTPKGKLGADIHSLFFRLEQAVDQKAVVIDGDIASLEQQIASGELEPEQEAYNILLSDALPLFGEWATADASRMAQAVQMGYDIFRVAYKKQQAKALLRKNLRDQERIDAKDASGAPDDTAPVRQKNKNEAEDFKSKTKGVVTNLLSFDQLMSLTFGRDSAFTKKWVNWQRKADNAKDDEFNAVYEKYAQFLATLTGHPKPYSMKATYAGQDLGYELALPKHKIKHTNVFGQEVELEFSQADLMDITMMWMQPKGRAHMMGRLDEDGNPSGSDWHYDQSFVDKAERLLTDEAKAIRTFLLNDYAEEWASLNEVFVKLNDINLPQELFYSPLSVNPVQATQNQTIDALTGFPIAVPNRTPPSLRSRGAAVAEPVFSNAIDKWFAHRLQMAHWKAYAEFNNEALSVLGHRNVRNAVEAKLGPAGLTSLQHFVTFFQQGGNRAADANLELTKALRGILGRAMTMSLFGRIGTVMIQFTQLGAAAAKMPVHAYLRRFFKLMSGQMGWGEALNSPYIQRRIAQMPPQVQVAMAGLRANKPSQIREAARRVGWLLSGIDGLATAGTYAMVYDYQLELMKKAGVTGAQAEAAAREEAERTVDEIAQPTRAGARSAFELSQTSPLQTVAWAFGSEPRKNLALLAYLQRAKRPLNEKGRALLYVLIFNGVFAALMRTMLRDLRDDEDDEIFDWDDTWNPKRLLMMVLTEPLYGVPVLGEMTEEAIFRAAREYRPEGSLYSVADPAFSLSRVPQHFSNLLEGEVDGRMLVKDINNILRGFGYAFPTAAGAAALSNLGKEFYEMGDTIFGGDE